MAFLLVLACCHSDEFFSLSSLSTVASTVASNQCFFCANMSHLKLAAIKLRHKFSTTTHHLVDFEWRCHGPHRKKSNILSNVKRTKDLASHKVEAVVNKCKI